METALLRKTVITALDLLRLRRMNSDEESEITAFAFPTFGTPQCVVKVVVEWRKFKFWYTLEPIDTIAKIREKVVAAFKCLVPLAKSSSTRELAPESSCDDHLIMRLSANDLATFEGGNVCQQPAKSAILVRTAQIMYKRPIFVPEKIRLELFAFSSAYRAAQLLYEGEGWINLTHFEGFFKDPRIHFDPLEHSEVKECAKEFYSKVYFTLSDIHKKLTLVHLDIRVENMF